MKNIGIVDEYTLVIQTTGKKSMPGVTKDTPPVNTTYFGEIVSVNACLFYLGKKRDGVGPRTILLPAGLTPEPYVSLREPADPANQHGVLIKTNPFA